jgi:N-acetylmuramoyl-L-alanine amidase
MRAVCDIAARHLRADGRFAVKLSTRSWRYLDDGIYLSRVVADSRAFGAHAHVAVHTNAGGTCDGTITFYGPNFGSQELADDVQGAIAPLSPGSDYGIVRNDGLAETHGPSCPAILTELLFHSNLAEARHMADHHEAYGLALARGVAKFWDLTLRSYSPLTDREKKRIRRQFKRADSKSLIWARRLIARILKGRA